MENAENLNKSKKRGSKINHEEWNAIARAVRSANSADYGVNEEGFFASVSANTSKRRYVRVYTSQDIPAYSVFGVVTGQSNDDDLPKIQVGRIGNIDSASPVILLTNGSVPILASAGSGWAHVIDQYDPVLVTTSDLVPVGWPCGPKFDTFEVTSNQRHGLVAISERTSNKQWVVSTREVAGVVGTVTQKITAGNPDTGKLGFGRVNALFREEDNGNGLDLYTANNPDTESAGWEFVVYNTRKKVFQVGEQVTADDIMGIGLVVRVDLTGDESSQSESFSESQSSSQSQSEGSQSGSQSGQSQSEGSQSGQSQSEGSQSGQSQSEGSQSGQSQSESGNQVCVGGILCNVTLDEDTCEMVKTYGTLCIDFVNRTVSFNCDSGSGSGS